MKLTQDLLDTVKAEAERGPPTNQYGYGRGGYSNNNSGRNGYNTGVKRKKLKLKIDKLLI